MSGFSMGIALEGDLSGCSGSLRVLEVDTLSSAVEVGVHRVAVTRVSRAGYWRKAFDPSDRQTGPRRGVGTLHRKRLGMPVGYSQVIEQPRGMLT